MIIKEDANMKFYNETRLLYMETGESRVGLEAGLLQTRDGTTCARHETPDKCIPIPITSASKSLSATEIKIQ